MDAHRGRQVFRHFILRVIDPEAPRTAVAGPDRTVFRDRFQLLEKIRTVAAVALVHASRCSRDRTGLPTIVRRCGSIAAEQLLRTVRINRIHAQGESVRISVVEILHEDRVHGRRIAAAPGTGFTGRVLRGIDSRHGSELQREMVEHAPRAERQRIGLAAVKGTDMRLAACCGSALRKIKVKGFGTPLEADPRGFRIARFRQDGSAAGRCQIHPDTSVVKALVEPQLIGQPFRKPYDGFGRVSAGRQADTRAAGSGSVLELQAA